ncbi:MAG: Hsp20/alpha crystallin family protein [Nanoarchaeota archaeon]
MREVRDPWEDMYAELDRMMRYMRAGFTRAFDESDMFLPAPGHGEMSQVRTPLTDVYKEGSDVFVRFELPGIKKEDIQLNMTDNAIELSVQKKEEKSEQRKGFVSHEAYATRFARRLPLPEGVDADKAEASFDNGILKVRFPSAALDDATKRRRLNID